MAGQGVDACKDECPWHIGGAADDLGVHQVAQAYHAGGEWGGDGHIVEHREYLQTGFPDIEPQGDDESYGAAVAGQSFVAGEMPRTVGHEMDGQ